MRRLTILLLAAGTLMVPVAASAAAGGLSPAQLNDHGWTCFNVEGLGVHCAPPGLAFPPTSPSLQLLYFFNTTDPTSEAPDLTGTETLIRDDIFSDQPCPTEPGGEYHFLGDLGGGAEYWACHRR